MVRITVNVEGMMCGQCEAHVNDTIRRAFDVKEVSSSHSKGETVIIAESAIDESELKAAINETGYTVNGIKTELYEGKKGLFARLKKS